MDIRFGKKKGEKKPRTKIKKTKLKWSADDIIDLLSDCICFFGDFFVCVFKLIGNLIEVVLDSIFDWF